MSFEACIRRLTCPVDPPLDVVEDSRLGEVEGGVGDLNVGQRVLGQADVVRGER